MSSSPAKDAGQSDVGEVRILDAGSSCPELPIVVGDGRAHAVVWPAVGARLRSLHTIELRNEARTITLRHPMEAVYYVIEGTTVVVDDDSGESFEVDSGAMVHIEPGTSYHFAVNTEVRLVGGPCPPDPAMYDSLASPDGARREEGTLTKPAQ